MVVPGCGMSKESLQEHRRQKNIVTFGYNMTIWLAETTSTGLVLFHTTLLHHTSAEQDVFIVFIYFLVTCGASPCLYFIGMR